MHRWFSRFSFSYMNLDFVCVWEVQSTKIFGHCWVLRPSQNQSTFRLHDFFFQTSSTYHSWASSGTAGFSLYVNHSLISQGMTWKVALFSLIFILSRVYLLIRWLIQVVLCQINIFCHKLTQNTTTVFFSDLHKLFWNSNHKFCKFSIQNNL